MRRKVMQLGLSLLSIWTFSQMRYEDQSVGFLGGGATGKQGYFFNLSYSRFIGGKGWSGRADLIYLNQKAKIKNVPSDEYVRLTQYMILPTAQYSFEEWNLDPFYISVYGGGMVGYEVVNNGSNTLKNSGITSKKLKNNFIYGAVLGVQGEVEMGDSWTVFATGSEVYRMNSEVGKFSFMIGGGVKYYF